MSIQAMVWVLEHSKATLAERLVLLAIANHADARGWNAYPSVPLIAEEAKVSEATVYRALGALEGMGELSVHRRSGRSNMYAIAGVSNPSQIERGHPSQIESGPLSNTRKTPRKLRPEPKRTVNEPYARTRTREPTDTRPFVSTFVPEPPSALSADDRKRGAEFMRSIRLGITPPDPKRAADGVIPLVDALEPAKKTKQ